MGSQNKNLITCAVYLRHLYYTAIRFKTNYNLYNTLYNKSIRIVLFQMENALHFAVVCAAAGHTIRQIFRLFHIFTKA